MKIAVIDGQGAGLGQTVIKKIRKEIGMNIFITALGTNDTAASNMVKAGANECISGIDNIILFCSKQNIDCIIGPIGIMCSGGINGEISSLVSGNIFMMDCIKYIIPLQKHGIYIPGTRNLEIKEIIQEIVMDIKKRWEGLRGNEIYNIV